MKEEKSTTINIRISKEIKEEAEVLFRELGLTLSSAFGIFIRQCIRQGKIPFELSVDREVEVGLKSVSGDSLVDKGD
jgi:DNA-damage-inducible protein J